jgi:hypothetical protein
MLYTDKILLYLDILNFKSKIRSTINQDGTDNEVEIQKIQKALTEIRTQLNIGIADETTSRRIVQFSDLIVVSFNKNEAGGIFKIIADIHFLIRILLIKHEILCRGAIASGRLFHDEKFIFGPALVNAYVSESKAAVYPRVIMDKSIIRISKEFNDNHLSSPEYELLSLSTLISKDEDEMFFIDYFQKGINATELIGFTDHDYIRKLNYLISKGLESNSPDILIKYQWMNSKSQRINI